MQGPWLNPRQSEEGWQQSNLVLRKVRRFFGLWSSRNRPRNSSFHCSTSLQLEDLEVGGDDVIPRDKKQAPQLPDEDYCIHLGVIGLHEAVFAKIFA